MAQNFTISEPKVYLAPLQGFTDYAFRQAFCSLFGNPDAAYSPFVETHKPDHRAYRDVLPERNQGYRFIPQILGNDVIEMQPVIDHLHDLGYDEINWNLGCPVPMVTRKKLGAGLLPCPGDIDRILHGLFSNRTLRLSVKMRLGLTSPDDWKELVPVLNRYPITEIIVHGRTASQMYTGDINETAFMELSRQLVHPVGYNGNITTFEQFHSLSGRLPDISLWMLGRGLISNPLLLHEIKTNTKASGDEVKLAICKLHDQLLFLNTNRLSGDSHLLSKMKPYWEYFALAFPGCEKGLKKIKKSWNLDTYKIACNEIFQK